MKYNYSIDEILSAVDELQNKKKGESNVIKSNIIGYFDNLTLMQKYLIKKNNLKKVNCRQTAFTANFPEKWQKVIPLIQDIGKQYKNIVFLDLK